MDKLTFPSRAALVWALSVVAACGSDPATAPIHKSPNGADEAEDEDNGNDDESAPDDTSGASTTMKDGGKAPSKDAGGSGKMDAGAPTAPGTKDAGKSASDAGRATTDAGAGEGIDAGTTSPEAGTTSPEAGTTSPEAGTTSPEAGTTSSDAGSSQKDAGSGTTDAGKVAGDAGATTGAGSCSGATPHGCYVPESDNPTGCPPQIHEQSAFYPPMDEWVACSSPFYARCNYTKPTGGAPAHCECDLGLHWLCTY
jgi:hypothetical protein